MSDVIFYYEAVDGATLTYNLTETTNYPVANVQDRNKNTTMRDATLGVEWCAIQIDFGAGNTRDANSLLFGNYIFVPTTVGKIYLSGSSTGAFGGEETLVATLTSAESATATTKKFSFTASSAYRYWQIYFQDDNLTGITTLQIGTLFLGTRWEHLHNQEIGMTYGGDYDVNLLESAGGTRYSQISNVTVRRKWGLDVKYITAAELIKWEAWRDAVFASEKISRYPFYFTYDGGTTLYYVRAIGGVQFKEQAYQIWETSITLEEEL